MDEFGKNNVIIVFVDINYTNLHYQFDHVANPFNYTLSIYYSHLKYILPISNPYLTLIIRIFYIYLSNNLLIS